MKKALMIAVVAVAAAVLASLITLKTANGPKPEAKTETAYERLVRTHTLRCGYVPFPPNMVKDPNTGKLSGFDVDLTEALGRKLGIKIVWAEEVGWGTVATGLKVGRYDAVCDAAWYLPPEAKEVYFSRPYYYQPLFAVVRGDDTRFDNDLGAINDPAVSIATLDGDNPKFIAEEEFPKAKVYTLPDMSGGSLVLESIASGKADVTFIDAYQAGNYYDHNDNKLKMIHVDNPLRVFPVGFILPMGDDRLRSMIDVGLDELIYSGQVDKLIRKYGKYPHTFVPVERPGIK